MNNFDPFPNYNFEIIIFKISLSPKVVVLDILTLGFENICKSKNLTPHGSTRATPIET